jgi:hypothetical protein
VDFDLQKIHPRSTQHGVGHIGDFLQLPPGFRGLRDTSSEFIETFIATELAFGHGGLVSKANIIDHTIRHAQLEYAHVFPMQQAYMTASPVSIEYWDGNGKAYASASTYIRANPEYADRSNRTQFMARVKVTYSNGAEVYVNRGPSAWTVRAGVAKGWFTYNIDGASAPRAGFVADNHFTLKPRRGWVGYSPLKKP